MLVTCFVCMASNFGQSVIRWPRPPQNVQPLSPVKTQHLPILNMLANNTHLLLWMWADQLNIEQGFEVELMWNTHPRCPAWSHLPSGAPGGLEEPSAWLQLAGLSGPLVLTHLWAEHIHLMLTSCHLILNYANFTTIVGTYTDINYIFVFSIFPYHSLCWWMWWRYQSCLIVQFFQFCGLK